MIADLDVYDAAPRALCNAVTTASDSMVSLINLNALAECGPDNGLFWQIGSSATIGSNSAFAGNILALTSITLNTAASIDYGRALAPNGAVTLENNRIDASDSDEGFCAPGNPIITPVPEGGAYGLARCCVLRFVAWRRIAATRRGVAVC